MEAFLVSFGLVALAELGDKTQLLALMLASRFHRPWTIMAGILVAVVLNHAAAAGSAILSGSSSTAPGSVDHRRVVLCGRDLGGAAPEARGRTAEPIGHLGVFGAALCAFFLGELGDKTRSRPRRSPHGSGSGCRWSPARRGDDGRERAGGVAWPSVVAVGVAEALRWGAVILSVALGIWTLMPGGERGSGRARRRRGTRPPYASAPAPRSRLPDGASQFRHRAPHQLHRCVSDPI